MTFSPAFLDELRARTSLSGLIGRSVKLQRAGREFKACCPFHNEKTPSFTINDEKGFYHCFGCGAHGDAIRFLTDARGLPFMDAVKELADAAGLDVPAPDPRAQAQAERAKTLYDVMAAAAAWFVEQLGGLEGEAARSYLHGRGIGEETRRRFAFGYAPESRSRLRSALREFGNDKLVEAGLLIQPDEGEPYDRFRGRLMIPIRDQRGRVIAFGGRILGEGEPKYLNSPETPLFDKGRTLYNLDRAAPASRDARRVIVAEGYMDVIALDAAGIDEAVAPLGTALTEGQLERLWRLAPSPVLCFDGDAAGQKASVRAALRALPHVGPGRSLSFASLPEGQDPDDIVRNGGRAAFEAVVATPVSIEERLWQHELSAEPLDTPERRAGLKRRLLDHAGIISDPDVREQYRHAWLQRFDALTRPQRREWQPAGRGGRFPSQRQPSVSPAARAAASVDPAARTALNVLRGLLRFPAIIADHAEAIADLPLPGRAARQLRDAMLQAAMLHGALDREALHTILTREGVAPLPEEPRPQRGQSFSFTRRDADPERACRDLVLVIQTLATRGELAAALKAATERLKESGDEAAFREQQRLRAARDDADRQLAALIEPSPAEAS